MKFRISRTSVWDEPPCPGAYEAIFKQFDVRTFKTPEEHDAKFPRDPWLARGTEHKLIEGVGISRRMEDRRGWLIELADLDALLRFQREHGDLVLTEDNATVDSSESAMPALEIYDDYRE